MSVSSPCSAAPPPPGDELLRLLRDPGAASALAPSQWSTVVRQGRATGLLGRLAERLLQPPGAAAAAGRPCPLPAPAGAIGHLEAARRVSRAQRTEVLREARHLEQALATLPGPVVLLKGAAYAVAGLPPAAGRVYGDVDVLVPRAQLAQAEALLLRHGWITTEPSAYNQRYYRRWMHELPPMQHLHRGTTLDVHHALVPPTSRLRTPADPLFGATAPLPGWRVLHRLGDADLLLHAMTHWALNDDVTHGLRDLSDLDLLWRHFAAQAPHGATLAQRVRDRAGELGLLRPLHHASEQLGRIWGTPVGQSVKDRGDPPGALAGWLMQAVWSQVLRPPQGDPPSPRRRLAEAALWLRGHWLRMPLRLLVPHLTVKALGLHDRPAKPPPEAGAVVADAP